MSSPGGIEVGRASVRVVPDTSRFREQARSQIASAVRGITAEIGLSLDTAGFRQSIQAATAGVRAQVQVVWIPQLAVLRRQLEALVRAAAAGVSAEVDVNLNDSGLRRLRSLIGGGGGGGPGRMASLLAGSFKALTASVAGLAALGGAVQVLAALGAAMTTMAPIGLALPGIMLGVAAAFATIQGATAGLGEAIKSGDLSALAPSAREFATAIRDLREPFREIQQSVQQRVFAGLGAQVQQLGSTYVPILRSGLDGIADQLNVVARGALAAAQTPLFQGAINNILGNTAGLFREIGSGVGDLASGFVQLGSIGSELLPRLGASIGGVALRFREFVEQNPDRIRELIDGAIQGFQDLGAIVGNVFGTIGSIFSGLSGVTGGSVLSSLRETTAALREFFETASTQTALGEIGETLRIAGTAVREILLAALNALLPILVELTPLIESFATSLSAAVVGALTALGPPLAGLIGALGDGLAGILPFIAQAFIGLAQALDPIVSALIPIVGMVGDVLLPVFRELVPVLVQVAGVFGNAIASALAALQPLLPPLVEAFTMLAGVLGEQLSRVIEAVSPALDLIVRSFGDLVAAVTPLIPTLAELAGTILTALADVIVSILPTITELAASIFPILIEAVRNAVPVIQAVADVLGFLIPIIADVAAFILSTLVTAIRVVIDVIGFFRNVFSGNWQAAGESVRSAVGSIVGFIGNLISNIAGIPGRILGVLGSLGNLLVNSGRAMVDGFLRGIQAAWNGLVGWVRGGMQTLRNLWPFSPAKDGPFSGKGYVTHSGRALTTDFAKAIRAGMPAVIGVTEDLMAGINARFSGSSFEALTSGSIGSMTADITAAAENGDLERGISRDEMRDVLAGWTVQLDQDGLARMVNRSNNRKARR